MLQGKLTFILAALAILGGVSGYILGYTEGEQAIQMVWAGLAAFGIRRAINNVK